jgi:hypothetical protein
LRSEAHAGKNAPKSGELLGLRGVPQNSAQIKIAMGYSWIPRRMANEDFRHAALVANQNSAVT